MDKPPRRPQGDRPPFPRAPRRGLDFMGPPGSTSRILNMGCLFVVFLILFFSWCICGGILGN
jgi:hypothetical protein